MQSGSTKDNEQERSSAPGVQGSLPASCPKCGLLLDASAAFCSRCGANQNYGKAWYYHPVWITVLALLVLGPFGLYFVWKSRLMGVAQKWVLTVLILLYTAICIYYVYALTTETTKQVIEFNREFNRLLR